MEKDYFGAGRIAGNFIINRYYIVYSVINRVRSFENSAVYGIVSQSHDDFWIRRCLVGLNQGVFHISRYRPGDKQHIGMPRRSDKMNTESFRIVKSVRQSRQFMLGRVG